MVSDTIKVLIADDHALLREGLRKILELEDDMEVVGEAVDSRQAVEKTESLLPDVVLMDINMPQGGGLAATRAIKERCPDVHVIVLTIHDDEEYVVELINAGAKGYMLKDMEPAKVVDAIRRVRDGEAFIPPDLMARVFRQFARASRASVAAHGPSGAGPEGVTTSTVSGDGSSRAGRSHRGSSPIDGSSQYRVAEQTQHPNHVSERPPAPKPPHALREPLTEREQEILQLIVDGNTNKEIGQKLFISEKTVKNHVTHILSKLDLSDRTQAAVYAIRHSMVRINW